METKTNTIQVSDEARAAIIGLQHKAGTYHYYRAALDRLFNTVLHAYDELGMDAMETVEMLGAIDNIRKDLAAIAGSVAHNRRYPEPTEEEIADLVEETFTDIDDISDSHYPRPEDESEEG